MNRDLVILVDEQDQPLGTEEKLKAHEEGKLHRAVSAFVFNTAGDMLIQKRASSKYHSPNLWSNTACTHPQPKEENKKAAESRLFEEMGFTTSLNFHSTLLYKANFDNGLTEHEFDHIFTGVYEGSISPNPEEVGDYRYISIKNLKNEIATHPEQFTAWFKILIKERF